MVLAAFRREDGRGKVRLQHCRGTDICNLAMFLFSEGTVRRALFEGLDSALFPSESATASFDGQSLSKVLLRYF